VGYDGRVARWGSGPWVALGRGKKKSPAQEERARLTTLGRSRSVVRPLVRVEDFFGGEDGEQECTDGCRKKLQIGKPPVVGQLRAETEYHYDREAEHDQSSCQRAASRERCVDKEH
jgi:hypothetical protein